MSRTDFSRVVLTALVAGCISMGILAVMNDTCYLKYQVKDEDESEEFCIEFKDGSTTLETNTISMVSTLLGALIILLAIAWKNSIDSIKSSIPMLSIVDFLLLSCLGLSIGVFAYIVNRVSRARDGIENDLILPDGVTITTHDIYWGSGPFLLLGVLLNNIAIFIGFVHALISKGFVNRYAAKF